MTSSLPPGWAWTPLLAVAECLDGRRIPVNAKERSHRLGDVPYYGATGQVGWIDQALFDEDLVLLGEDGAPFLDPLKPKAYGISGPAWVNNHAHVLRATEAISTPYLTHVLNTLDYGPYVNGTTRLKLTQGAMRDLSLPLAPLREQDQIVNAIEEYLSRLDNAIGLVEAGLARLPLVRRAVLDRVMPDPLPAHWKLLTVEKAGHVDLGRQRSPQYHSGPNMRPYLRVANVHEDRVDLGDVKEMHFPPEQLPRYELQTGDILLNEGQSPEFVGRPAMYRGELQGACFTNSLIRFRPFDFVDGEYALFVFLRHLRFGRFQREAQITTNIAHMAAGRFKRVEFPVPPVDVQREIVEDVRRQLSLLDAFDAELRTALQRSESLRGAILAAAFRGELVPQDPTDEPASKLLVRIAVERPAPSRRTRQKNGA